MCGIGGGVDLIRESGHEELEARARRMLPALAHRGPDDAGVFVDARLGVHLAHRRLAVLDLSSNGAQPMITDGARHVLSFNGEIYNHLVLRRSLRARFRGTSDTETLLAAVAEWGLPETLRRVDGMFAFALLDRLHGQLHLVRDRLGEKPLYVHVGARRVAFASELAPLRADVDVPRVLDAVAVSQYLRYGFVPGPRSIWAEVQKLAPGSVLTIDLTAGPGEAVSTSTYWSVPDLLSRRDTLEPTGSLLDRLETAVEDSVRLRTLSDVPVGVFLSGGLDSSLVAAMAARSGSVTACTVSFPGSPLDEAAAAAATARTLGLEHQVIRVGAAEALAVVPELGAVYDEPFADPSSLPTLLLSRLARSSFKVALSGDAGDEVFGGYRRYRVAGPSWARWWRLPLSLRAGLAATVAGTGPVGARIGKAEIVLGSEDSWDAYRRLVETWDQDDLSRLPELVGRSRASIAERMLLEDLARTLPDQMFVKVDRAAMSTGLEVRMPLASPEILDLMWSLPAAVHLSRPGHKTLLRELAARVLPGRQTAKKGFDPPLVPWLHGPLHEWSQDLLADPVLGLLPLEPAGIARARRRLRHGSALDANRIWSLCMFAAWARANEVAP